ncbi:MAG: peptidoglycan DL-endopeptidase CwlO, partial [Frankiales bacterium]|nr:peptidoglycan DL-endopeptidase CwlO [Frankiales bacterium]
LDDSLDVADESYRNGQIALQQAEIGQAAADRRLAAGRARRAALQSRVNAIAALAYQTGAAPDVMLASPDGVGQLAESTAMLSQFAADQDNTLSAAAAAQYDLAVAQTAAAQSAAATARTSAQLAAAKAVIVGQVAAHQQIVDSLISRQHTLEAIAAEKARLAVIAAAKAAAEKQAAAKAAAERAAAQALAAARKAAAEAAAAKAAAEQEAAQRAADRRRQEAVKAAAQREAQQASSSSSSTASSSSATSTGSAGGPAGPPSSRAAAAVAAAYQQLGAPYDWAADGPGSFDCSGLTAYAWAAAGVTLPHSSQAQFDVGAHVSRSELAPGDLVFFGSPIHHVGIYIGNGQMIDAPQTGDVVRVQGIGRSDYTGAVRVTG